MRGPAQGPSQSQAAPARQSLRYAIAARSGSRCLTGAAKSSTAAARASAGGAFGVVYRYDADKGSCTAAAAAPGAYPAHLAVKFFAAHANKVTEEHVLLALETKGFAARLMQGGDAVLAAHLLQITPVPIGTAASAALSGSDRLGIVLLEPADGALQNGMEDMRHLDLVARLSWRDAAAVTRAVFEEVARFAEVSGLLHVDIKAGNILYSATSAAAAANGADGTAPRRTFHVFAADLGSLTKPGANGSCTYVSPAAGDESMRKAHWGLVAFQLGFLCCKLVEEAEEEKQFKSALQVRLASVDRAVLCSLCSPAARMCARSMGSG